MHLRSRKATAHFAHPALDIYLSERLNLINSPTNAEHLALHLAFQKVLLMPVIGPAVIIRDSRGALQHLRDPDSPELLVQECASLYHSLEDGG